MKNLSRNAKLGIGIVLLLVILTAFAALQRKTAAQYPKLSTISTTPDGALALKLWVKGLKYSVDEAVLTDFAPPKNTSILFMLEPLFPTDGDMKSVDQWVENGG